MNKHLYFMTAFVCAAASSILAQDRFIVQVDGQDRIGYQAAPLQNPQGGDRFRASNFLHPVKTPSGFTVTQIQPRDHMHHMGVWWPWKYVESQGRRILFWELQRGHGIIEAQRAEATENGFTAKSHYIDRRHPDGPHVLLHENADVQVSDVFETQSANGYFIDLAITHQSTVDHPVTVTTYRYSGFTIRGTELWNNNNSTLLTSEGKDRSNSHTTRARWVRLEGQTDNAENEMAGILLMSHQNNFDYPEHLRTWNERMHDGAFFVNFNNVQQTPWIFEPSQSYTRRYRMFVYDGTITPEEADTMQREYND